jgi:Domain of unknown function (DUF4232)
VIALLTALVFAALPSCRTTDFAIHLGPLVSEATGQESLPLVLHSRGRACGLDGYPTVALRDAKGPLPFVVGHAGDQMVTAHEPAAVVVRPGRSVFVLVNKYRCDLGDKRSPRVVSISFPGRANAPALVLGIARYRRDLGWCGPGDPGSTLAVSPFEPTFGATFRGR